ncbi:MAG: peptide ABC transporter substrate-binding protein [Gammaproteobacteria bacterium]|nr:peptide ABC transporter substrate-binding protein [Gammaproteobacteria bacterium]
MRRFKTIVLLTFAVVFLHSCSLDFSSKHLKLLYWQAPSMLNPFLSSGTKDMEAASIVIEPLARYDANANRIPILATKIPTIENGGIPEDRRSITWHLREDVVWSDGTPLTAHDVVFSWQYCTHEEAGCTAKDSFRDVEQVVAVNDHTVRIDFVKPNPFPFGPFVGSICPVLQAEQFKDCLGLRAQECTRENFYPIGTGPYIVDRFRANDTVVYRANPRYREEDKPFFRKVVIKGGGDAPSAARAVLQTGEFDYAWNLQIEPEVLSSMRESGKGEVVTAFGSQVERIMVNQTNNDASLDSDTRSVFMDGNNPHPFLSDLSVRRALSLAIDRQVLVDIGYGIAGEPTCNVISLPEQYVSKINDDCKIQDIEEANRILDEAGWVRGTDGIRAKDGVRLSLLYQTSTNSVRQGTQSLIKDMWQQIGVETELRNIDAAVFFGSDAGSPDTLQKFYADVQMYTNSFEGNDPSNYVEGWQCENVPGPHNQWVGVNISRGCSEEYDMLLETLSETFDPAQRIVIIKQLNDMVVQNYWEIPLIHRARVSAKSNSLKGFELNGWDSELWNIADWYREE